MEFNVYVPSYRRSDAIKTGKCLEYCTYVVRKSEEEAYRKAGIENLIAVEDEKINSCAKVYSWIYFNAKEDVFCILDDDIEEFYHCFARTGQRRDRTPCSDALRPEPRIPCLSD